MCECGGLSNTLTLKSLFAIATELKVNNTQPANERGRASRENAVQSVIMRVNEQQSIGRLNPDFDEVDDQFKARERRLEASREIALQTHNLRVKEAFVPIPVS